MEGRSEASAFEGLLERESEREAIGAALDRLTQGTGGTIVFEAPAGLGKTTLLRAAAAEARRRGLDVLATRAVDLERGLPYGAMGHLLVPALVDAGPAERDALLAGPAALAGPVLGVAAPSGTGDPVAAALHGLYWLCVNLADRGPRVLVLDDAHWADEASLRFLVYLTRRLEGLPLLLALGARPAEQGTERDALEQLLADPSVEVHVPRALSHEATATVLGRRFDAAPTERFCRACHDATGGNPFLLGELIGALADEGIDPASAGATAVEQLGPPSVARSVLVRLRRLPSSVVDVARAVAIFPGGAELRHVAALTGLDAAAVEQAVDDLAEAAVLAPGRPLAFLHPVMRTAVYQDLPGGRLARLHLEAAQLLRGEGAAPGRIATHLMASDPGGDPQAFADLVQAAGLAIASGAPGDAVAYLDRALQEPVPDPAAAQALHLRGMGRMLAGDPRALEDLEAAAARATDPGTRATVLHDLGRVLGFVQRNVEAAAVLDEAMDLAAPALRDQCSIDRTWVLFTHDDLAARFDEEMRGLEVPDAPSDLFGATLSAIGAHWEAWQCGSAQRARELAERALLEDVHTAPGLDGVPAVSYASVALYLADRPDLAVAAVERQIDAQRQAGAVRSLTFLHLQTAMARVYAGDLADAESDLQLAAEYHDGDLAGDIGGALVLACRAVVALERRGTEEAAGLLGELRAGPTIGGMAMHAARGRIHLAAGRPEAAFDDLHAAQRSALARGLRNPMYLFSWGGHAALAAAAVGDRGRALTLADEQLRLARGFGAAGTLGAALRVAGLVRGGDTGLTLLLEAVSVLERSGARLLRAEALTDLGAMLRRGNQRAAAREPLHLAIDLARRCDAAPLAERAMDELRAAGGRLRAEHVTGVGALTPSERRVARMAAAGMTNRQIAQQLFVTVRTVETHLTGTFSKLGIGSRAELAGAFAEEPAPPAEV